MATARRCSGCGASLGDPTDDDLTVVCRFCGLRHDLDTPVSAAAPVGIELGPRMRRTNRALLAVILGLVAIVVALALFAGDRTAEQVTTAVRQSTAAVTERRPVPPRPLALADLAGLTEFGWKIVDTSPLPGGYDAFDPVTALPWAMSIGRAWAADAVLTRIDVGRVAATGAVDLAGEATSGYRFSSPARQERWRRETDAGAKSITATALTVQIQGTTVKVLVQDDRRDAPAAPAAVSLPLPAILERARRGRGFADRPFYAGYMIHLPREGWVWYFSSPSGDSFPRVRARDGRAYPY
ncbi:MAG: hypothetical protein ABI880_14225 [Acidobacteriota bacterium]